MKPDIRLFILILPFLLVACSAAGSAPIGADTLTIQLNGEDDHRYVEVNGLPDAVVRSLHETQPTRSEWQTFFSLSLADMAQPMLGEYAVDDDTVRFTPTFPLLSGQEYEAVVSPAALVALQPDLAGYFSEQAETVTEFKLSKAEAGPTTVTAIYPTAAELPSNILRFYVYFSAPMQAGNALDHVALHDAAGNEVPGVFFDPIFELWDPSQQRLTLLFDPGRVKTGLRAHEELGRALVPGEAYTLRIKSTMLDAHNNRLDTAYEKTFQATEPDLSPPDVDMWDISLPSGNSADPLIIQFLAPLDHQLLKEFIQIRTAGGAAVKGDIALSNQERTWQFTPESEWQTGTYELWINTKLEDIAGNNLHGLFDIPPEERPLYLDQNEVKIEFEVE